jgi:hypothetical protein
MRNLELNQQVESLQSQVEMLESSIQEFEVVKSDWQMEKEALEEVLLKLREEAEEGITDESIKDRLRTLEEEKVALLEERVRIVSKFRYCYSIITIVG